MSELLPIYPEFPKTPVETVEPKDRCPTCTSCAFSGLPDPEKLGLSIKREIMKRAKLAGQKITKNELEGELVTTLDSRLQNSKARVRTVCMPPEGESGGLLIVSDYPGLDEDKAGRPMIGRAGRYMRSVVRNYWKGPIAIDNAIKCAVGSIIPKDTHIKACRPYLASTINEVKPTRIIAMGSWAMFSLLGRKPPVLSVRRGYSWVAKDMTPIFMLMNPAAARRNTFVQKWFEEDLEWACTVPVKELLQDLPADGMARVIRTVEDANEAVEDLCQHEWFTWDVETAGNMFTSIFKILCVGMAGKDSEDAWVWSKEALANKDTFAIFRNLMMNPKARKIAQHGKYDIVAEYAAHNIDVAGTVGDTLYWRKLMESDVDGSLEVMQELVGMGGGKEEAHDAEVDIIKRCRTKFIGKGKTKREVTEADLAEIGPLEHVKGIREGFDKARTHVYALLPEPILYRYVAKDAISTARVARKLQPELKSHSELQTVWDDIMGPATDAVSQVEKWGVAANIEGIHAFQSALMMHMQELDKKFSAFGDEFNPGSSRHVAWLLYDKLGMKPPGFTETKLPKTDAASLKILKGQHREGTRQHDMVSALLDHRMISKQKGTYADGLERFIRQDSRIHPRLNLHGTRTGRLSCSDPNLQNITRSTQGWFGKMARDVFVAPPGRVLVQLDFSQLELRVAAILSGDDKMKNIFMSGTDYHQATAELIAPVAWGLRSDQLTKEHRSKAKTFNFGLLYGMTDAGLAQRMNCTRDEAAKIRAGVLGSFTKYAQWSKEQVEIAERTGYIWTWWNGKPARKRSLWRIKDQDEQSRARARNGAGNTPVQGTASDFCLASLVECVKWLIQTNFPAKLVLTVHDSLIFEVDIDFAEELIRIVMQIMTSWPSEGVPVVVDADIGLAWGSLYSVEEKNGQWVIAVVQKDVSGNPLKDEKGKEIKKIYPWREVVLAN